MVRMYLAYIGASRWLFASVEVVLAAVAVAIPAFYTFDLGCMGGGKGCYQFNTLARRVDPAREASCEK
jgi:hypothetical protein